MEFDNDKSLRDAKAKLPLHRLMEQHGDAPPPTGKRWGACPICKKKDTARVTNDGNQEFFKCANETCPSGTSDKGKAWTELGYLGYKTGQSGKELFITYLKEAGVFVEPPKKTSSPTPAPEPPSDSAAAEEKVIQLPVEKPAPKTKPEEPEVEDVYGRNVLEFFYSLLTPTEMQMVPYLPGQKIPDPIPAEVAKQIKFKPVSLFEKRGCASETCDRLGFRANPESNLQHLLALEKKFGWDEIYATGLWQPPNKKEGKERRPNKQFYGLGQIGKKPETERRNEDDKWVWAMSAPILIPYFDEAGKILKLRPHKGGAPADTLCGMSRIYVPRDYRKAPDTVENFNTVIICEGEFKAVAVWQTHGAGRKDGKPPVGVCAIPGINFGKHDELRLELEWWLRAVRCRQVIVVFDDEDKTGKPRNVRLAALTWARYLASDLIRKLHIMAKVAVLPPEWRDAKGKSDWDGALARILKEETK